jgi:hypothetical protein
MKLKGLAVFSIGLMGLVTVPQAANDFRAFVSGLEQSAHVAFIRVVLASHENATSPVPDEVSPEKPATICSGGGADPQPAPVKKSQPVLKVRSIARTERAAYSAFPKDGLNLESAALRIEDLAKAFGERDVAELRRAEFEHRIALAKLVETGALATRLDYVNRVNPEHWQRFIRSAKPFGKVPGLKVFPKNRLRGVKVTLPEPPAPAIPPRVAPAEPKTIACSEIRELARSGE